MPINGPKVKKENITPSKSIFSISNLNEEKK